MFKTMYTYISFLFFIGGLLIIVVGMSLTSKKNSYALQETKVEEEMDEKVDENPLEEVHHTISIHLSFIGDSLLASFKGEKYNMNFQDLLDNNDYSFPFKNVASIFLEDDFTIANGENVFTDKKLEPTYKDYSPAYWYYSASRFANVYKESGIEVVSIMNNHTYDYGQQGYLDTMDAIHDANLLLGGEEDVILEKNGIKIGLICINLFHRFQAVTTCKRILELKDKVNYVIIYFHGGTEYAYTPNSDIVEYSHSFIDAGADLVVGCHPHVLESIEVYKDKTIVYSLGSFLFGGTLNLQNRTAIYQVFLEFNLDGELFKQDSKIIPCYLYSGQTGYEKWIPGVITNESEKQKVIDFMNGLRSTPT